MITEMIFVTNNHILVQFDENYVPKKDAEGKIDPHSSNTKKS